MTKQGGYLAAKALKNEGVECIFTLCGGHIQSIYGGCLDLGIKIIDVRHEQAATHAADGWARVTRKPGVAIVTAGPGLTDSITGIANAMRAGSPMIVIGGQAPVFQFEKGALQETDHLALVRPITKWAKRVNDTWRIPEYISIAFRQAMAGRPGPVFLEIPIDKLMSTENEDTVVFPESSRTKAKPYGDPTYIERAAELLSASKRPAVMAGSQIWWDDSGSIIEELNPLHLSRTRGKAMGDADVVLVVGAEFDFRLAFGDSTYINSSAKIIQIHVESSEIGRNRPVDTGIIGDTQAVLRQICEAMGKVKFSPERETWFKELRGEEDEKLEQMERFMKSDKVPIHPARLCREVDEFLDEDAIIIGDGGDIVSIGARILRARAPGQWLDPGPFGCLGMGVPFGLAARLAKPDKQLLLLYGDGSFGLNGMEMDTAVRFDLPMVVVIGNDGGWGQMRVDAQAMGLSSKEVAGTELGFTRYDKMVEAFGGLGIYVEEPSEIRPALERAFESNRPACVNVKIDPDGARQMLRSTRGMV